MKDAEWIWTASGGINREKSRNSKYAGSDNIDEVAWYYKNSQEKTHIVGQKKANKLGIYDMSGNVWEWNETEADSSTCYYRGGSWDDSSDMCNILNQLKNYKDDKSDYLGFRVCRVLN